MKMLPRLSFFPLALALAFLLMASALFAQATPSAYTTGYRYDSDARLIGTIRPSANGANAPFLASRTTYNAQGLVDHEDNGSLAVWQSDLIPPANWTGFSIFETVSYTYDTTGRELTEEITAGGSNGAAYALTQYTYDDIGRVQCVAQRMNTATYSSLPVNACTLGSAGTQGSDRITYTTYDPLDRPLQIQKAYGTPLAINYATYTYYPGGPLQGVTDANGNYSYYTYDSLIRLQNWYFPSPTNVGSYNPNDYEQYGYDADNNRTSLRKRDGTTITYDYDALNRVIDEIYPTGTIQNVYYSYDLRNLQLSTTFGSNSGPGLTQTYDGFGHVATASTNQSGVALILSYQYDAEGNRIQVTHPDGTYFQYSYDGLNRLSTILENGSALLITESYDTAGRRQSLQRGALASSTSYAYDPISRLQTLTQVLQGTAYNEVRTFGYNPANQVTSRLLSNPLYAFAQTPAGTTTYQINGLNQYSELSTSSAIFPSYDANGNMTFDGATTFNYDLLNRLTGASGGKTVNLSYDPKGRLFKTSGGVSGTTQFLYDGDALVAEYDGSGTLLRRYVHGSGADEPLVTYEGSMVGATNRRYFHADHQGSVIAIADANGNALQTNTYDPYGVPATGNVTRFQYTGQIMLPDLGQYYYKARIYNPTLGRFMQTDPIGYKDNLDLYGYTADDPINEADPNGQLAVTCNFDENAGKGACKYKDDGKNDLTVTTSYTDKDGNTSTLTKTYDAATVEKVGSVSSFINAQYRYGMGVGAKLDKPDYSIDGIINKIAQAQFPALPGNGANSMGSTGRQPQNIKEQEAMREAQSDPEAGQQVNVKGGMEDSRWLASQGWEKMRQNINGVEVHYNYNKITGATDDWKIK